MTMILKLALAVSAVAMSAGVAHAQAAPANPAPDSGGGLTQNAQVRNGGDTFDRDVQRARDEAVANQRNAKPSNGSGNRSHAASPEDIVAGAEIRDPKGLLVGHIESVSMASAVVVTSVGKVEVPLEAFGKNAKGLLISMSKADFEKAVADANKPQ